MATAEAHIPPQNLEAEESVLGAMMVSEGAITPVLLDVHLEEGDFYRDRHRLVYAAVRSLYERSEPVDALTVSEHLAQRGELDQVGGRDVVSGLASTVPAPGNARHYARIVKQNSLLRRLLAAAQAIQQSVHERDGEPRELVEQAERLLFEVAHTERTGEFHRLAEILVEETERLERLASGDGKLTGTPSGFRRLDEVTGGFQPGNLIVLAARPAMGKCLGGTSLVHDPRTGARTSIADLVSAVERGDEAWVTSVDSRLRVHPARVGAARRSGVQQLYRLATKLGRQVEATSNHPLMTATGWKELGDLQAGDRIAVPRRLPSPSGAQSLEDHHLVMLAALIADGNLTNRTPRFCFGRGSVVVREVERAAATFGTRLNDGGYQHGTATISAGRGSPSNPVRELCEEHGIWGQAADRKHVPDAVFGQAPAAIARFLSILFACDEYVYINDRFAHVGYTTISERLARDVQHLLLRLGVVAGIRYLKRTVYEGTGKRALEVRVTGQSELARFCRTVIPPGKEREVATVLARLDGVPASTNADTVPVEIWEDVLRAKGDRRWAEVSAATGRPRNHNWHVGRRGLSRGLLGELATATASPRLAALARSDLWWDEVSEVEELGEGETFDLEVPGNACFVADDIVVHNSALVCNIAENVSSRAGKPVAFFSLEMSETELAHRFISSRARISADRLRKGQVSREWQRVVRACNELEQAPLWIDDSSDLGLLDLRAKARRLVAQEGELGLVIVDYIQLMRAEDPRAGRVEQVGQMSRGLKILARELDVPVIGISQLSRAPEQRPDKVPILADLRESGSIEQDSDVVAFIFRDEYYTREESKRPGEADLIIAKHRNGPVATIPLAFMEQYPKFADLTRQEAPGAEQAAGEGPPLGDAGEIAEEF